MSKAWAIRRNAASPANMRRFVLCRNIERLTQLVRSSGPKDNLDYFHSLIRRDRRDLALLDADEFGAFKGPGYGSKPDGHGSSFVPAELWSDDIEPDLPTMILAAGPGLQIIYANQAFSIETGIEGIKLIGRQVYEAFPENPEALEAECISHTLNSINRAVDSKQPEILPTQRFDIRNPDGVFVECYWRIEFVPLLDSEDDIEFIKVHLTKIEP